MAFYLIGMNIVTLIKGNMNTYNHVGFCSIFLANPNNKHLKSGPLHLNTEWKNAE